jgi:hypothetical protein
VRYCRFRRSVWQGLVEIKFLADSIKSVLGDLQAPCCSESCGRISTFSGGAPPTHLPLQGGRAVEQAGLSVCACVHALCVGGPCPSISRLKSPNPISRRENQVLARFRNIHRPPSSSPILTSQISKMLKFIFAETDFKTTDAFVQKFSSATQV